VKCAYEPAAREATAYCRSVGACETCRRGKKRVDHVRPGSETLANRSQCDLHEKSPYEFCTPCASLKRRYKGISRLPCFLSDILDVTFFRKGEFNCYIPGKIWGTFADTQLGPSIQSPQFFDRQTVCELVDVSQNVESPKTAREVRTLQLCQICGPNLEVYVTKFKTQPGDKVNRKQRNEDGEECILEMPHFCLTDIDRVRTNMEAYIGKTRANYLGLLRTGTDITWSTTKTAIAYAAQFPVYSFMEVLSIC